MKIIRTITILSLLLVVNLASAGDWPQYLGPDRNAVSKEKGLIKSWPAEGPKVLEFNGYNASLTRSDKVSFGAVKLESGNHSFKFEVIEEGAGG